MRCPRFIDGDSFVSGPNQPATSAFPARKNDLLVKSVHKPRDERIVVDFGPELE